MIRQAIPSDEPEIRKCAEQAYARYVPLIGRKPAPMVADFATRITEGNVYVATDEQLGFQGFIVFLFQGSHVLLENVAVLPHLAGRGVGKALILFCENAARDRGIGVVRLYTNEKMTENLSIYPRLGYAEMGRRAADGFNRVYFEKMLK